MVSKMVLSPACTVRTEDVALKVFTDYPALQFYTGKYLDCGLSPNAGLAVELQKPSSNSAESGL